MVNRLTSFDVCGCLSHTLLFLYSRNLLKLKFWSSLVWVLIEKIDSTKTKRIKMINILCFAVCTELSFDRVITKFRC